VVKFSKHFGINQSQVQLDFVDIDTESDLPLFIDPYIFSQLHDGWSVSCHEALTTFFETVLECIRDGRNADGRALLRHLREPNETCLGVSSGRPAGRGIGNIQADELYDRITQSKAAASGLLSELSDCELFIEGVGSDKISDLTTNIIKWPLIEYTQAQCDLHHIHLTGKVGSGPIWNSALRKWEQKFVSLPIIDGQKLLLVPKASVRWAINFSHTEYYNKFVLEFLQAEHLSQNTALVEALKNGNRRVTKKSLKEVHPLSKAFLGQFSIENPEVLENYKKLLGVSRELTNQELEEGFDEGAFAEALIEELKKIQRGRSAADAFHKFMVGTIEFLFYPDLIYPEIEDEINEGRKRIDIVYTNSACGGFFFNRRSEARTSASRIIVECKNYQKEIENPELDQIAGRFAPTRGRLGLLIGRSFDNREKFIARCRDSAREDRGYVIALVDDDVIEMLEAIKTGKRSQINRILEQRFSELLK